MIDLTPLDVRNKRGDFRKNLRGYDSQEVDTFLELVAERMEELVMENLRLQERSDALKIQVESQSGREKAVQEALVTAQKLRAEMREQAEREAEIILSEARTEGRRIHAEAEAEARSFLRDAERRLQEATSALDELERRRLRFLKAYRQLLEREMDVVQVEEERAPLEERPIELDLLGGFSTSGGFPEEASQSGGAGGAKESAAEPEERIEAEVGSGAAGPDEPPLAREAEEPRKPGPTGLEEVGPSDAPARRAGPGAGAEGGGEAGPAAPVPAGAADLRTGDGAATSVPGDGAPEAEHPTGAVGGTEDPAAERQPRPPSGKPTPAEVAREALAGAAGAGLQTAPGPGGPTDGPGGAGAGSPVTDRAVDRPVGDATEPAAELEAPGEAGAPGPSGEAPAEPEGPAAADAHPSEGPAEPERPAEAETRADETGPGTPRAEGDGAPEPSPADAESAPDRADHASAASGPAGSGSPADHGSPAASGSGATGPEAGSAAGGEAGPGDGDSWQSRVFSADEAADDVRELIERLDAIRGLVESDRAEGRPGAGADEGGGEGPAGGDRPPEDRGGEEGRWS